MHIRRGTTLHGITGEQTWAQPRGAFRARCFAGMRARSIRLALTMLLAAIPMCASGAPNGAGPGSADLQRTSTRSAIALDQVSTALTKGGLDLTDASVKLLVKVTANDGPPTLIMRSIAPWGTRDARVRLECAERGQCLPFYVAVEWTTAEEAQAHLKPLLPAQAVSASRPGAAPQIAASQGTQSRAATTIRDASPAESLPRQPLHSATAPAQESAALPGLALLRAGSRAKLILEGDRLHIELPVVCLEAGSAGKTIRVTGLDHKQTYTAQIVDAALLKGTL